MEYRGSDGQVQRWYAYGAGPNEVLARMEVGTGTRAPYIPDSLGSVLAAYASDTGARTLRTYRPFGEGAGTAFPFAFTGQRLDAEAGDLHYFRARHYHPALGRFLQTDPIGYDGGANLYAYVSNDPLNNTDASGLLAGQGADAAKWSLVAAGTAIADAGIYAGRAAVGGGELLGRLLSLAPLSQRIQHLPPGMIHVLVVVAVRIQGNLQSGPDNPLKSHPSDSAQPPFRHAFRERLLVTMPGLFLNQNGRVYQSIPEY